MDLAEQAFQDSPREAAAPLRLDVDGGTHARHGIGFGDDLVPGTQLDVDIGEGGFVANFGFHG